MLVSFSVENWKVFKNRATLSLKASREKMDAEKSAVLPSRYGTSKILPAAAIYGANASGKSSLIQGLSVVKKLVIEGTAVTKMIPVQPFRLDPEYGKRPTTFIVEALISNLIYVYEISCTKSDVIKEKLVIRRTRTDQIVFERNLDDYVFGPKYDSERVRLIAENTRPNQLFLHNAVAQNANDFRPMFDWFDRTLTILGTDAQYEKYSQMLLRPDFLNFVNKKLRRYNTGAAQINLIPVDRDTIPMPQGFLDGFISPIENDPNVNLQIRINREEGPEIFIVQGSEQGLKFSKVKTVHMTPEGKRIPFDLSDESKGTQKLIELLPIFFDLAGEKESQESQGKVYLVDELDRSFHSALTIDLVKGYLDGCSPNERNQLIFSTHDLILMEEKVLRRDELWFCVKGPDGSSTVKCLGSHPGLRSDTDLLKNYREGLFGGYPSFQEYECVASLNTVGSAPITTPSPQR